MARLLIVDDEPSIRDTLSEFIREDGYEVSTAADATAALDLIRKTVPDVVITDIILPRVTGVSLLREIHEIAPDVQVIMITGEPTAETAAEAVRLGAFDYLSKPILRDDFKSAVASALRVTEMARRKRELEAENLRYQEHLEEEVDRKTKELRASEERFRRLFEVSPIAALYVDPQANLIVCNERFTEMHGMKEGPDAQIGRNVGELVSEEDLPRFWATIDATTAAGRSLGWQEYTLIREDGTPFSAEVDSAPVVDADGEVLGLISMAVDITDRKRAEHAKLERQARIQQFNQTLLELTTQISRYEGDLDSAIHLVSETAARAIGVEQVGVWLIDDDEGILRGIDMYHVGDATHRLARDYPVEHLTAYLREVGRRRVLSVSDVHTDPRTAEFDLDALTAEGIASVMNASIRVEGRAIGDVTFEHAGSRREWTHEEEEFAGGIASLLALTIESSQRLKAEQALRASEERHRVVVEHANEAIFVVKDERIVFANPETSEISGWSDAELLDRPILDLVDPEDHDSIRSTYQRVIDHADLPPEIRVRVRRPDGNVRWLAVRGIALDWEGREAILCFANDVTDRLEAERAERNRQQHIRRANEALVQLATQSTLYEGDLEPALRLITETAADVLDVAQVAIWLHDRSDGMLRCSDAYNRTEGVHRRGRDYHESSVPNYLKAMETSRVLNAPDALHDPRMAEFDLASMAEEGVVSVLDAAVRSEGRTIGDVCFEHAGEAREWTHDDEEFAGDVASLVALTIESVERRRAERALERREKEYEALFEDSPVPLWVEDYSAVKVRLDDLRTSGVRDLETYLRDHPEELDEAIRAIRVVDVNEAAVALYEGGSKDELLRGLDRIIDRSSRESVADQMMAIWEKRSFFEGTSVNRTLAGRARDVTLRWAVLPGYEETLERVLIATTDVTAIVEAEQALRQALTGTIEAIGLTTETRDPYTAGHQRRVTALAVAIAEELGLQNKTMEATRAAGLLHDIGKMAIPAEILSKPSKLTEMEMALMRTHPEVAYDILKSVTFPWPLAQIVLQHHERMDGSGYPQGLAGNAIRIEARVLAVADTVEAMASHRPYRAALGIDLALDEITAQRGVRYDAQVVDACLRLFRESRFGFPDD